MLASDSLSVGIISFSITRLKLLYLVIIRQVPSGWNHKFLDYEIETKNGITGNTPKGSSWNHKFLDYEIETLLVCSVRIRVNLARWNHKFLDYEIETLLIELVPHKATNFQVGIISFSITRLKHFIVSDGLCVVCFVGIISFSITRLKQQLGHVVSEDLVDELES